jgi:2-polyprenyl-3-methyl-5-hydroxy-6-metoxy-1,4-benzoquinol methylase
MANATNTDLDLFLNRLEERYPLFWPTVKKGLDSDEALFRAAGDSMVEWAKVSLGDDFPDILAKGYAIYVTDVNRSQMKYERAGAYANKTYDEVYEAVYNNSEHMSQYHWGVYVINFVWDHHLRIYKFFLDEFVKRLGTEGKALDLGCGSGIWGMTMLKNRPDWNLQGIDISETSVALTSQMATATGYSERAAYDVADALKYSSDEQADAGISCFLLEHLEAPADLLANLAANLKPRSFAFVTGALTAAEVDHIAEFRRESELINLAEEAGFRVVASTSASPSVYPDTMKFLPRAMAMVLQKRDNDIW